MKLITKIDAVVTFFPANTESSSLHGVSVREILRIESVCVLAVCHSLLLWCFVFVLLFLDDFDWSTGRAHPDADGRSKGGHRETAQVYCRPHD